MRNDEKLLDSMPEKALETSFWRAEYVKRKAYIDDPSLWRQIKRDIDELEQFLANSRTRDGKPIELPAKRWIEIVLDCYLPYIVGKENWWRMASHEGLNYFELFEGCMRPDMCREEIERIFSFSVKYGHKANELVRLHEMGEIAELISGKKGLPDPPLFFWSENAKENFSEDVMSVIQLDWKKEQNIVEIAGLRRNPKMVFTLDPLHSDFDLELAVQTFRDYCAHYILVAKSDLGRELSVYEKNSMREFYARDNKGSYGKTYSMSRAAGLWMWDRLHPEIYSEEEVEQPNKKSDVISQLRESRLFKNYSDSSDKTIYRLISAAEKCIEAFDVLPVKESE